MISYPFLNDLFKAVLAKSKAIQGRFHICPKFGVEINSDELGAVLKDLVDANHGHGKRYPMSLLMPPRSSGEYAGQDGWDEYMITMFFLKQSFVNSENQVQDPNPSTGTSQHTIPFDWHDMKRAAIGFMRALNLVQRRRTASKLWFLSGPGATTSPVSQIGVDGASGVRLDFRIKLMIGCFLEDYTEDDVNAIVLPTGDSHPEHSL